MAGMTRWLAVALVLLPSLALALEESSLQYANSTAHHRVKRVLYISSERRLTFPPETVLVLTPTLSLPFARNLPVGYGASMTISIPFKIAFDDLGITSEENPWGIWPIFDAIFRKKRDTYTPLPGINWAGGDREMMYQVVEDTLTNMGMDGKACLLRAICEMFQYPLDTHGFFGEVLELFLSASRSPHSEQRLGDYTRAERVGRSSGDCFQYQEECPHSLFTNPGQTKWLEAEQYMHHYSEGGDEAPEASEKPNTKTPKKSKNQKSSKKTKTAQGKTTEAESVMKRRK